MPFEIIRGDITKLSVDAIVNAANRSLLGGGGVDGAIHRAAGPALLAECRTLGGCEIGKAKITKGYKLPSTYIIHTVGPIWHGGTQNEEQQLRSCYMNALALARERNLASVAFPLISSGAFGYPKDQALRVAVTAIRDFLLECDMSIYIVVFDKASFGFSQELFTSISQYIDDCYVAQHDDRNRRRSIYEEDNQRFSYEQELTESVCKNTLVESERSLADVLSELDDTFSERLLRLIAQKGYSDVITYKKANIDRKLFSKIRSDKNYKPSKATVLAFSLALRLSLDETKDFLMTAGFALSRSSKFDVIIEYFITHKIYDIYEVNEALFAFEQPLLGG